MSRHFTVHAIYVLLADMKVEDGLKKGNIIATDGDDWYIYRSYYNEPPTDNPTDEDSWPLRLFRDYWRVIEPTDESPWGKDFKTTPRRLIKGVAR